MEKHHDVSCVVFENDILTVSVDGRVVRVPARNHPQSIRDASEAERTKFEISPPGYGIHWPTLDEDLSIDGILGIEHSACGKSSK